MNSTDLSWWYGTYYGDSWYKYKEFTDLANAKSDFAGSFSAYMKLKQPYIDSYYNNLFGKINNFLDKIEFTKEGITTLEKHKGRKMSTNEDVKTSTNEDTKKSTKTDLSEKQSTDITEATTHGKTEQQTADWTDTNARNYFGSNTLVDRSRDTHAQTSGGNNKLTEGGTTSVNTTGNANNNEKITTGSDTNNFTKTIKNKNDNYTQKVAHALDNYTTIEDISNSIFDKDVMDYNNYKETTTNTWHEGQMAVMLLDRLKDTNFIEKILHGFFCTVSCDIS